MSKEVLITCNGCGRKNKENNGPLLVAELDNQRDDLIWAHVQKMERSCFGIETKEYDYCHQCWLIGFNAINKSVKNDALRTRLNPSRARHIDAR